MDVCIDRLKMNKSSFEADPIQNLEETPLEIALCDFWEDESADFRMVVICAPDNFDFDDQTLLHYLKKYVPSRTPQIISVPFDRQNVNCFYAILHSEDIVEMLSSANNALSTVLQALLQDSSISASKFTAELEKLNNSMKSLKRDLKSLQLNLDVASRIYEAKSALRIAEEWKESYATIPEKPEIRLVVVLPESKFEVFKDTTKHFPNQIKYVVRVPSNEYLIDSTLKHQLTEQSIHELGMLFRYLIPNEVIESGRRLDEKLDKITELSAIQKTQLKNVISTFRYEDLRIGTENLSINDELEIN